MKYEWTWLRESLWRKNLYMKYLFIEDFTNAIYIYIGFLFEQSLNSQSQLLLVLISLSTSLSIFIDLYPTNLILAMSFSFFIVFTLWLVYILFTNLASSGNLFFCQSIWLNFFALIFFCFSLLLTLFKISSYWKCWPVALQLSSTSFSSSSLNC